MSDTKIVSVMEEGFMSWIKKKEDDFYTEIKALLSKGYEIEKISEATITHQKGDYMCYAQHAILKKPSNEKVGIQTS